MVDKINKNFYHAFEEKYRGTRELIKSRLRVYLPFVEPLRGLCGTDKAVDLGCGRGEWLDLLQESGFDAQGVDIDDGMLAVCRERELNVITGDAVAFLKGLPEASMAIVSGFHLAEHIPFADLQILVEEALRVLKPGGLLILETPNPENIVVGTADFYLDPAHLRPIPSQLLSFLPEYYGFEKVKILRLQEPVELSGSKELTLFDVLNGVSPDYAVVAQKTGSAEILAATNPAFEIEYGITIDNLATRYEQQAESGVQHVEAMLQQAESRVQHVEAMLQRAESKAQRAKARAQQAYTKAQLAESKAEQTESKAQLAESKAEQAEFKAAEAQSHAHQINVQLNAVYSSNSWRIAAPLRWTVSALRGLSPIAMKAYPKTLLGYAARYVTAWPRLKSSALALPDCLPGVKLHMSSTIGKDDTPHIAAVHAPIDLASLTPRACRIYVELKAAIERRQKGNC